MSIKMRSIFYGAVSALLFFLPAALSAVGVYVEPTPVVVGEPAQVILNSDIDYPVAESLPDIENLKWLKNRISKSSDTRIINNKRSVNARMAYPFVVTAKGSYLIPPMKVKIGGRNYATKPMEFKAVSRRFAVQDKKGSRSTLELADILFARLFIPDERKEYYIGEEIPFEFRVYAIDGLGFELSWPQIDWNNVVIRDYSSVNKENRNFAGCRQFSDTVKGKAFTVYAFRTAFRPIAVNDIRMKMIENCRIRVPEQGGRRRRSTFFDDDFFNFDPFFSRHRTVAHTLTASLKDLKVKALPEKPSDSDFLGLVGNWYLNYKLTAKKIKAGEPFTVFVDIRGYGTLDTLNVPELKIPGFRSYPPEIDKKSYGRNGVETAQVRYVLIPLKEGRSRLALNLCVFSPERGEYVKFPFSQDLEIEKSEGTVSAPVYIHSDVGAGTLKASAESDKKKRRERSGILYLKKRAGGGIAVPLWRNYIIFVVFLVLLAPIIWVLSEIVHGRKKKLGNNPHLRRKKSALAAKKGLVAELKRADPEEIVDIVNKKLVPYLNDLLLLPPGTTATELAKKVSDPQLAECLKQAGSAYMPGSAGMDKTQLKNTLWKAVRRFSVVAFIFLLPFLGYSADSASGLKKAAGASFAKVELADKAKISNSEEAQAAYDSGEFERAARYYLGRIKTGRPDPAFLYNLGNCLCQMGDFSRALVCYERARRLAPRDSDILENLNFVRRKLFLPEVGNIENPGDLVLVFRDYLRPDQWMLLAAFTFFLCVIVIAFRRLVRNSRWIALLVLFAVLTFLFTFSFITQYMSTYGGRNAVVIGRSVPVYSLPSEKSGRTEFKLRDGESLELKERRADWVRVRADNVEGWIHGNELATLWGPWDPELMKPANGASGN